MARATEEPVRTGDPGRRGPGAPGRVCVASSPGVPRALAQNTLNVPYNNLPAAAALVDEVGGELACIIVEPVA